MKLLLLLFLTLAAATPQKIKLRDIEVITLKAGHQTTARRTTSVPQMKCTGTLCNHASSTIQCKNTGWDGNSVQWECSTDLPSHLSLGTHYVSCEGYDYPDDPYVLVGSCGLSYYIYGPSPRTKTSDIAPIIIVAVAILLCGCNNRPHRPFSGSDFVAGAATGAAAASFWPRRRRRYRSTGIRSSFRRTTSHCGTKRR